MHKKSIVAFTLAGALVFAPLVGCAAQSASNASEAEKTEQSEQAKDSQAEEQLVGGWTINKDPVVVLTDDERGIFEKAMEGYTGVGYEPVSVLATQVVAGTNYAYLCKATTVTANPTTNWAIVEVYNDLEGNASITKAENVDLGDIKTEDAAKDTNEMDGAWQVREPSNAVVLPADANEAFNKASEGYDGVGLTPMVLLGTQVVAGTNYLVLCQGSPVTENPVQALYVAQVYADLQGNAEFTSVAQLNLLAYV